MLSELRVQHIKQPDGRVVVTVTAFGDTVESVVPSSLCECTARVRRHACGELFLCLYDNRGDLVVASRVFTADEYAKAG